MRLSGNEPSDSYPPISRISESVRSLLRGAEIYPGLSAVDFREMAKFTELTNIWGLPVHTLLRPPDPDGLLESEGGVENLPDGMIADLRAALAAEPQLLVEGRFAAGTTLPFRVSALLPRSAAHLAQAWDALLWPAGETREHSPGEDSPVSDLTLIQIPDFPESALLSLPEDGVALILGTDDPRAGLFVAMEWSNRRWSTRNEFIKLKRLLATEELLVLLPGGCFCFLESSSAEGGGTGWTIVYPGETVPVTWEEILSEAVPALRSFGRADLMLAGVEPWCAAGGGSCAPFCRNALLPFPPLRDSALWQKAALHPDAIPFGLRIDEGGEIDWQGSPDDAFVIVPRHAAPNIFPRSAEPLRPQAHFTHRAVKPEAMELWAMGFPSPEVLGPGGRG